jgi:pilus assembly protein CpaE
MEKMTVIVFEIFPKVDKILTGLLRSIPNVDLIENNVNNTEEALDLVFSRKPDIIIFGNDFPGKDGNYFTQIIRKGAAPAQVIMIAEVVSAEAVRQAMRAGACDFISYKNLTVEELSLALERAGQLVLEERNLRGSSIEEKTKPLPQPQTKSKTGEQVKIIALYSPKGGSGVSTITANLSRVLANDGHRVLILDGDFHFGDMSVLLNQPSNHSISDLARFEGNIDEEIIKDVITAGDVDLLAAPPSVEKSLEITGPICETVINALSKLDYDILLINTSSDLSDPTLVILEKAETVILVVTQEISSVRAIRLFLDLMRSLSIDLDKFEVVVNRFEKNSALTLATLNKNLDISISHTIPQDNPTVLLANNLGVPFAVDQKNLPISKSISDLANYLLKRKKKSNPVGLSKILNNIKNIIRKKRNGKA